MILLHFSASDELLQITIWVGGRIKFTSALSEVGDQLVGVFNIRNWTASGARNATDEALCSALAKHATSSRVVGMDNDSIWDIAPKRRIGMSGGIENFGIDSAHSFFGIAGLNRGVAVFGDANPAHGEKTGRSLTIGNSKASFSSATAKSLMNFLSFKRDDVHSLTTRVNDVEPLRVVVWMSRCSLCGNGVLNFWPFASKEAYGC